MQQSSVVANWSKISFAQGQKQGPVDKLNISQKYTLQKLNAKGTLDCTGYSGTSK